MNIINESYPLSNHNKDPTKYSLPPDEDSSRTKHSYCSAIIHRTLFILYTSPHYDFCTTCLFHASTPNLNNSQVSSGKSKDLYPGYKGNASATVDSSGLSVTYSQSAFRKFFSDLLRLKSRVITQIDQSYETEQLEDTHLSVITIQLLVYLREVNQSNSGSKVVVSIGINSLSNAVSDLQVQRFSCW